MSAWFSKAASERGAGSAVLDRLAEGIIEEMKALTDDELAVLSKACSRATSANCWFGRYDMAKGLLPFIEEEQRERPIRRRYEANHAAVQL